MTTRANPFLTFLSLCLLGLAAVAAIGGYGVYSYLKPGPLKEVKLVLVDRGMGVSAIARKLESEQVISSNLLFKIAAHATSTGASLKAGEYEFPARVPMAEVLRLLHEGEVYDRRITIREGLTSWEVVQLLNANDQLGGDPVTEIPPEGTLLPETYTFITGDTKQKKINLMREAMTKTIDELWPQRVNDLPIETKEEALILASIIEKETGKPEERYRVAGVFVNRLKRGMPLQTDPTVIYAITKGEHKNDGKGPLGRRLLRKDLEIDSPYNTYKYPGLPPGPIANPGRASIAAALNPEQHDYVYFVADGTGGHMFGKTLAEHNRNVAKWRQIRRAQGQ